MKNILSILSLTALLTLTAQSTSEQILSELSFPSHFNESGSSLFYTDWNSTNNGHLWTEGQGSISFIGGKSRDMSFGKNRVVGSIKKNINGQEVQIAAYIDSGSQEWVSLGVDSSIPITNQFYSSAWGINEAGDKIVGLIFKSVIHADAYVWTEGSGYTILPNITQNRGSRANGISKKGNVIYGHITKENGVWTPCVWVDNNVVPLTDSEVFGDATAASHQGTYVAANLESDLIIWSKDAIQKVTFTDQDLTNAGLPLGQLFASSITEDKIVYGLVGTTERKSFAWDETNGIRSFNDYIKSKGITGLDDFNFTSTVSVSNDGKILAGSGGTAQNQFRTYILKMGNVSTQDIGNPHLNTFIYPTIVENDEVTIKFSAVNTSAKNGKLTVADQTGKTVFAKNVTTSKTTEKINLNHLNKGIYFINLKIGETSENFKIIKK